MSCPERKIVRTGASGVVPELLDDKKISNNPKHYKGDQLKRKEI